MLSSKLEGDKGVSMLSKNEPLEGKATLALPQSCMQQLLMSFDLSFPFVVSSMLVRSGKPSVSPILDLWNGLIDAEHEVALVASSSLQCADKLSSLNNGCPWEPLAINSVSIDLR
jgi:hypothetical protein